MRAARMSGPVSHRGLHDDAAQRGPPVAAAARPQTPCGRAAPPQPPPARPPARPARFRQNRRGAPARINCTPSIQHPSTFVTGGGCRAPFSAFGVFPVRAKHASGMRRPTSTVKQRSCASSPQRCWCALRTAAAQLRSAELALRLGARVQQALAARVQLSAR